MSKVYVLMQQRKTREITLNMIFFMKVAIVEEFKHKAVFALKEAENNVYW